MGNLGINGNQINYVTFCANQQQKVKPQKKMTSTNVAQATNSKNNKTKKQQKSGLKLVITGIISAIAGLLIGGKAVKDCKDKIKKLEEDSSNNRQKINELENANETLTNENETLADENETLKKANDKLKEIKDKIDSYISEDLMPSDVRAKIEEETKSKILDGKIKYNIMSPPIKEDVAQITQNGVELPEITKSGKETPALNIPEIANDGSFEFEVPTNGKLDIVKEEAKSITEKTNLPTSLSQEYNRALQNWDNDKIARDILQNFYDGHGQTLDGVKITYTPTENGRYKVKIEGKSTYTHDKALLFGSEKSNNAQAAGNYGEGLKITVLKLLKEKGAENVCVGSQNWKIEYKMDSSLFEGRSVMAYDVKEAEEFLDGSYFEFETNDKGILESLRKSINRFYHSNNTDFQNLDFDSQKIGIKILPEKKKGGLYIAGQRFEFDNDYDGLEGANILIKEKLPENVVDPSRDRTTLNASHLESIARYLASGLGENELLTNEETGKLIKACEKYWLKTNSNNESPLSKFITRFVSNVAIWKPDLKFKFPEKYVAYSSATNELVADLKLKGYKICDSEFKKIGMQDIHDLISEGRAHIPLQPTETEEKKIKIIKEALNILSNSLKKEFTPEELDTKIYIFDGKNECQKNLNEGTLAEAITEKGESKGYWIDRDYLNRCTFHEAIVTTLHEMSHKEGGDESSSFSYKLTDVVEKYSNAIVDDNEIIVRLQTLSKMWDDLEKNPIKDKTN